MIHLMEVYVTVRDEGEYSDRNWDVVGVDHTFEDAQKRVAGLLTEILHRYHFSTDDLDVFHVHKWIVGNKDSDSQTSFLISDTIEKLRDRLDDKFLGYMRSLADDDVLKILRGEFEMPHQRQSGVGLRSCYKDMSIDESRSRGGCSRYGDLTFNRR